MFNPIALGLWTFATSTGYALGGEQYAAAGLALASGFSFFADLFTAATRGR
jgi:hypothetical protein